MQKEEAIKIYKSFASMKDVALLIILVFIATYILISALNNNSEDGIFIYVAMWLTALPAGIAYIAHDILKSVNKLDEIVNEDLDDKKYLEIIYCIIDYGKNHKQKNLQRTFYLIMQERYAMALIINGKRKEAEEYINSGEIKHEPYRMFSRACIDLDRAYAQGDAEKYIKIYKAAPKSYKEVKLHACRALLMQGKYDEAIEELMKYTPKNKREEILSRFTIGEAHLRKGSKDEAKIYLEYVINNGKTLREKFMAEELYKEL